MQKSFLSHIINKHDNLDESLFNKCNHEEIKHRTWLDKSEFKFNAVGSAIEWHGQGGKLSPYYQFLSVFCLICQILDSFYSWGSVEECITVLSLTLIRHCMQSNIYMYFILLDSPLYEKMYSALTNASLVSGIKQASPGSQTSCLEGFHSPLQPILSQNDMLLIYRNVLQVSACLV